MIAENKADRYREQMEAATFTAWQIMGQKGLKKRWAEYRKTMGVEPINKDKLEASEKEDILKTSLSIHERVLRLQKNGG